MNNNHVLPYLGSWQELQLILAAIFLVSLIRHSNDDGISMIGMQQHKHQAHVKLA